MQNLRQAVAELILQKQHESLSSIVSLQHEHLLYNILLDETRFDLTPAGLPAGVHEVGL